MTTPTLPTEPMPFRVSVLPMYEAGKEPTFMVCIDHPDRPQEAKPWDDGRITPFHSKIREHAELEAQVWREFLNGSGNTSLAHARSIVRTRESAPASRDRAELAAYPLKARVLAVVEQLAREWDGCEHDVHAVGSVDIGEAIRRSVLPKVHAMFAPECAAGVAPEAETFEQWVAREYESANGFVSSGDPKMWGEMQHAKAWARRAWNRMHAVQPGSQ